MRAIIIYAILLCLLAHKIPACWWILLVKQNDQIHNTLIMKTTDNVDRSIDVVDNSDDKDDNNEVL